MSCSRSVQCDGDDQLLWVSKEEEKRGLLGRHFNYLAILNVSLQPGGDSAATAGGGNGGAHVRPDSV